MATQNKGMLSGPEGHHDEQEKEGPTVNDSFQNITCGFYGMVVFVMGFVFPISTALSATGPADQGYLLSLHVITNIIGICFLIYLLALFIRNEVYRCGSKDTEEGTDKIFTSVYWDSEGVSLYVRLGAVLFGLATLLQGVFRLASECRGSLFEVSYALYAVFVVLQTVTLVKYHKACISTRKLLARWGFAHLIAVNLNQWAFVVTAEITEQLIHKFAHAGGHGDDHGDEHADGGHGGYMNGTMADDSHDIHKRAAGPAAGGPPGGCRFSDSLQYKAAPYLFPCIIEYSLIMAAISYKLYFNVTKQHEAEHHEGVEGKKRRFSIRYFISGTIGTLTLIAAFASVVLIFVKKGENISVTYFYYLEVILLVLALAALIVAVVYFTKLGLRKLEDMLDGHLLLVAFFLNLVIDVFTMIGSIAKFYAAPTLALAHIFRVFFSIIQSLLQVIFILDALARCAKTRQQSIEKPGRYIVFFLLLVNIGLWIMAVFEIKMYMDVDLLEEYYGALGWTIIKAFCTPLVIFYRFHSTVCLADIFSEAYHFHPHSH